MLERQPAKITESVRANTLITFPLARVSSGFKRPEGFQELNNNAEPCQAIPE